MKKWHLLALSCLSLATITSSAYAREAVNLKVGGGFVDLDARHHMQNTGAPTALYGI